MVSFLNFHIETQCHALFSSLLFDNVGMLFLNVFIAYMHTSISLFHRKTSGWLYFFYAYMFFILFLWNDQWNSKWALLHTLFSCSYQNNVYTNSKFCLDHKIKLFRWIWRVTHNWVSKTTVTCMTFTLQHVWEATLVAYLRSKVKCCPNLAKKSRTTPFVQPNPSWKQK